MISGIYNRLKQFIIPWCPVRVTGSIIFHHINIMCIMCVPNNIYIYVLYIVHIMLHMLVVLQCTAFIIGTYSYFHCT